MIKILFFQCCRSGKVSECWNSTTCGSKGNSTQCVRDSNRCNVWENKGKLMKIKLRCSNIYFIWLCTCAVVSLTFLGINFHGMSKITISRIHTMYIYGQCSCQHNILLYTWYSFQWTYLISWFDQLMIEIYKKWCSRMLMKPQYYLTHKYVFCDWYDLIWSLGHNASTFALYFLWSLLL